MLGRRVAILGGTFNPVHLGHLVMAEQSLHQFDLDQVLWIPAGDPPHKPLAAGATSQDRWQMLQLAIADHPRFVCSDLEMQRQGPSYAVDTLRHLHRQYPDTLWFWIIGVDALKDLPHWHQAPDLIKLCHWIVAPRVDNQTAQQVIETIQERLPIQAELLQAPYIEISSTFLREQIHQQGSIRYLVPPAVADYIQQQNLYR
ncbi:MAG: nicotinate-nucleotide adenylyltransferase [Cyanobacteriota bacterium]|nr:nicotinate-nucleotide adenylyltransferase [Cyanobacteriota bacterium]